MSIADTRTLTDTVSSTIEKWASRLIDVSHTIHAHPELAFEEHRASALLADAAQEAGFTVTRAAYGLETAFEAVRGSGPFPPVVVCAEYDALPDIGHACGHNVIAAAGLGAAIALGEVAEEHGLTVVLLGTPAEEHGGGKVLLLERGAWEGAAMSIMVHGAAGEDVSCTVTGTQAVDRFDVTYTGRAAHAAAAPHKGINAGDAATIALVAIGLLRQQLPSDVRLNAYVEHGGEATNIIRPRHWCERKFGPQNSTCCWTPSVVCSPASRAQLWPATAPGRPNAPNLGTRSWYNTQCWRRSGTRRSRAWAAPRPPEHP